MKAITWRGLRAWFSFTQANPVHNRPEATVKHPHHTHPGRHKPHHSDHSGAHAVGTHEHMQNAENPLHGQDAVGGGMAEGSPAEEASESPQEEAAEQSAGIGGAAGPGGTEGSSY